MTGARRFSVRGNEGLSEHERDSLRVILSHMVELRATLVMPAASVNE